MIENKNPSPSKPPIPIENYIKIFLKFDCPESIKNIAQQIVTGNFYPILRVKLEKITENALFSHILEKPKAVFKDFKDVIMGELRARKFDVELMKALDRIKGIHIIPDITGVEHLVPEIKEFSKTLVDVLGKLCRIKARYLDWGIHKRYIATVLTFRCNLCGSEFEIMQFNQLRGKYKFPSFCMRKSCKARSRGDFTLVTEKTVKYEAGVFAVKDLDDYNETEKECHFFENYDYFHEKTKQINVNDEIEIIGTISLDYSDINTRKDFHEITDYIEAYDFKILESKKYDEQIVDELYNDFKNYPDYNVKIIESIHNYSSGIYEYFIEKNLIVLNWITSDSFRRGGSKRNTLNVILGGHRGLFKSSIGQSMQDILGISNVGILSGKDTTNKGLIPTTQRNNDQKNLVKRIGAIPYYNKKMLIIDEAQYLDEGSLESMKALDDGKITRALDGSIINAPAETSITLLMNYKKNQEQMEAYDYAKRLYENLAFPKGQESILDRFDLHYAIPKLSKIVKRILRRRLFSPPKREIAEEKIYNYLFEAKRIYTDGIQIPDFMIEKIEALDDVITALKDKNEINTSREFGVLLKTIKGIAAMKFKTRVDDTDLEYLKKHLISTIIPFYDNPALTTERTLNIDEIFFKTFYLLTEVYKSIPISEHIIFIREYLSNHYFPKIDYLDAIFNVDNADKYLSREPNTSNTKYKKMVERNQAIIKKTHFIGQVRNATHFINKAFAKKIVTDAINSVFADNNIKTLDFKSVLDVIELALDFSGELISQITDELIRDGVFKLINGRLKKN